MSALAPVWRSEDNLEELVLSSCHFVMGSNSGSQALFPTSHLASPKVVTSLMWLYTPLISALGRLRQEDHHKFEVSLIYIVGPSPASATQ